MSNPISTTTPDPTVSTHSTKIDIDHCDVRLAADESTQSRRNG